MTIGSILGGTWRFVRANIPSIAIWCLVYLLVAILARLAMGPMYAAQIAAAQARAAGLPPVYPPIGRFLPMSLAMMVVLTMLYNAVFRAALFPGERGLAYLRLGLDEARLFGLMMILGFAIFAAVFAVTFLLGFVGAILATAFGIGKPALGLILFVAFVLLWCALIFVAVRLVATAPMTLRNRRITIAAAWSLTKGRFWTLFGAFLVFTLAVMLIAAALVLPQMGAVFAAMSASDPAAAQAAMAQFQLQQMSLDATPAGITWLVASAVLGGIAHAALGGMAAVATMQLIEEKEGLVLPASIEPLDSGPWGGRGA